ncbi:MAG: HAMP domain-containing protein [Chthoniobacterales bacterium]|nr:HAMP domain-containing protein [Chthoniobacterales bacterium]
MLGCAWPQPSPAQYSDMSLFNRLSIQSKMIVLLLAVSLGSIAVMAWIGYDTARTALMQSARNQLQGVRVAKTTTLKAMLESLRDQVVSISDSKAVIEGMRAFREAHRELGAATLGPEESRKLDAFYRDYFLPELDKNVEGTPVLEQYLPVRPSERYLQYHYTVANPHPYGDKQNLEVAPGDATVYGRTHEQLHRFFARAVKIFGFQDMMLVDADTLDVIYSYEKTAELGTNLENGPYANTHLGAKVREMRTKQDRDDFKIADFEAYRPSLGRPMGFAISPIFDGAKMTGMLVLQFPIDNFNAVLTGNFNWQAEGMGETGETYLVGPDGTMRTRSRFMYTDPEKFVRELRRSSVPSSVVDQVERQGNVLCVLPAESPAVEAALKGESGIMETTDYRGEKVLSAYGPLELDSLRWAVIADVSLAEAQAPVRAFARKVVVAGSGLALCVTLLALVCAHMLTRPLRKLAEGARRLGAGETGVRVDLQSSDEFGELARVFNEMAGSIHRQKQQLEAQVRENQDLLHSILPASAVAQRQEGDEKASRQFADVSVLFAEILGLEDFSAKVGETKALSVLGDLIESFDEAAEKSGIEKVKTIGGSYLAVCGLSVARPDHARRMVEFAREMTKIVGMFNRDHHAEFGLAVGINSGPVVGGVVGRRKFLYDLWGDTVTIARKLAAGQGAAVRVTPAVRERTAEQFQFRGPVRLAGEGRAAIELWEVTG